MASATSQLQAMAPQDMPVIVKVSVNDVVRRFKIALSDVTPQKFHTTIRGLLQGDFTKSLLLERYSDSACTYITLDTSNPASYKQLYRAAKAKAKLRLKATYYEKPKVQQTEEPAAAAETPAPAAVEAAQNHLKHSLEAMLKPPFGSAWQVCCNNCNKSMLDSHYHCGTCAGGDYDLCEDCVSSGITCPGAGHWLIKRNIRNGQVINSTTERLTPQSRVGVARCSPPRSTPVPVAVTVPAPTPAATTVAPAPPVPTKPSPEKSIPGSFTSDSKVLSASVEEPTRTCNGCVKVLPEKLLVNCSNCEDFDLCISCMQANSHGHHPGHRFAAITEGKLSAQLQTLCAPGRAETHWATCDGCDERISGVRHKCLDCPDWDLCGKCYENASSTHPKHRFVPVYEKMNWALSRKLRHAGVFCDGPLCRGAKMPSYITGVRFKCAICHDTDFCANCEAHPSNKHNATHPLIMFKTPVKNASISTTEATPLGQIMATMGDVPTASTAPKTAGVAQPFRPSPIRCEAPRHLKQPSTPFQFGTLSPMAESVRALVEAAATARKPTPLTKPKQVDGSELDAHFVHDTVADGSLFTTNQEFQQTWTLRNPGPHSWPVGVTVRNTGGDNMLNIDPYRPASSTELSAAQSSQATDRVVAPEHVFSFSVTLRSPLCPGKHVSYWRARAPDGTPFGHKLWCEIEVAAPDPSPRFPVTHPYTRALAQPLELQGAALANYQMQLILLEQQQKRRLMKQRAQCERMEQELMQQKESIAAKQDKQDEEQLESTTSSQMIFPKLDKESPESSTNLESQSESKSVAAEAETAQIPTLAPVPVSSLASPPASTVVTAPRDFESVEFDDDSDEETFLTDDEYDILDASDEEVIVDNGVPVAK